MKASCILFALGLLAPRSGSCQIDSSGTDSAMIVAPAEQPVTQTEPVPEPAGARHERMYRYHPAIDLPISAIGSGWTLYAFGKIYSKDTSTLAQILSLNKDDVNGFDRWAAGKNSDKADKTSDLFLYGSVPLPFLLFLDRSIRRDAGNVSLMYWEAFSVTGLLYTSATYFVDRYRPETYNADLPAREKVDGNYKNAFFAGHVSVVGTATFFMAKVYSDYHPHSPWRWAFWGGAAALTGTTIYLRHEAGKHWPSDLVLGTAVGVASGVLIPQLHKNKLLGDRAWLTPYRNYRNAGTGLSLNYRF